MSSPSPWDLLHTEALADYRVFSVSALKAKRQRDGYEHTFFRIDSNDWVNVVALTSDDAFVMVRQYRQGAGRETLEIPGGLVDPGETPAQAAARELREETGYGCRELVEIGRVNPNPALFATTLYTYLALGCRLEATVHNDAAEETVVEVVPRSELPHRVRGGEVDHALVLAGLHWLWLHEMGQGEPGSR